MLLLFRNILADMQFGSVEKFENFYGKWNYQVILATTYHHNPKNLFLSFESSNQKWLSRCSSCSVSFLWNICIVSLLGFYWFWKMILGADRSILNTTHHHNLNFLFFSFESTHQKWLSRCSSYSVSFLWNICIVSLLGFYWFRKSNTTLECWFMLATTHITNLKNLLLSFESWETKWPSRFSSDGFSFS